LRGRTEPSAKPTKSGTAMRSLPSAARLALSLLAVFPLSTALDQWSSRGGSTVVSSSRSVAAPLPAVRKNAADGRGPASGPSAPASVPQDRKPRRTFSASEFVFVNPPPKTQRSLSSLIRAPRPPPPYQPTFHEKLATVAQAAAGTALIVAFERSIWALGYYYLNVKIPSAPVGMIAVFVILLIMRAFSQEVPQRVVDFFEPSLAFFQKGVPLFFSAPLVPLPAALSAFPLHVSLKVVLLLVSGTFFSLATTAFTVSLLFNRHKPVTRSVPTPPPPRKQAIQASEAANAAATEEPPETGLADPLFEHFTPKASIVLKGALVSCLASSILLAAARVSAAGGGVERGIAKLLTISVAISALQIGKTLDPKIQKVIPAIVTCSAVTSAFVAILGTLVFAQHWKTTLVGFRTASGGLLGGTGVGDIIFALASPAIVALGFNLYKQRRLLQKNFFPILAGAGSTGVVSVLFTAAFAFIARLPADVGLAMVPRFITLPIAVPIVESLGGNMGLAGMGVIIQGIVGANFGIRFLDWMGIGDPLSRGVAIGAASHALGTASVANTEPEISPPAAVTFLLAACICAALVQLGPVRTVLLALFAR